MSTATSCCIPHSERSGARFIGIIGILARGILHNTQVNLHTENWFCSPHDGADLS